MVDSKRSFRLSQVRVGIFVLFGLAILAFLIMNSTGDFNPFQKKLRLKAHFMAADGLREGSEVQLAGVRIGKVDSVQLLPPDVEDEAKIEAVMTVDHELNGRPISERIRTDSTAQLVSVSLLASDKLINISPGSSRGDAVSENFVLEARGSTTINNLTETGNELLDQIKRLAVPANEILTKANRGEGTLGRIVNDESLYRNLDTTIADAKTTIRQLQQTLDRVNRGEGTAGALINDRALYDNLNKTVTQIEAITNELRAGRGTAGKVLNDEALYNDTRVAINELRAAANKINLMIDDVNAGKGTIGKLFTDDKLYADTSVTLERFNNAAVRIESFLADAQAGKGTFGRFVTDDTLYNNTNSTVQSINKFSDNASRMIDDFRREPKKYLRIKLSLF
jgi:phospholipid/cholesterol/gamma-HCH transport system substrate-binding protein